MHVGGRQLAGKSFDNYFGNPVDRDIVTPGKNFDAMAGLARQCRINFRTQRLKARQIIDP
jgi:hypothetical protein